MNCNLKELMFTLLKMFGIVILCLLAGKGIVEFVVKPWADTLPPHPSENRIEVKEYQPLIHIK